MGVKLFSIIFELIMMFIFMLIGYYFYSSNGKATKYLTGFNMRKEEEKKKVDEVKITKEYGFILMMMALPFILGMFIDIQSTLWTNSSLVILVCYVYILII